MFLSVNPIDLVNRFLHTLYVLIQELREAAKIIPMGDAQIFLGGGGQSILIKKGG